MDTSGDQRGTPAKWGRSSNRRGTSPNQYPDRAERTRELCYIPRPADWEHSQPPSTRAPMPSVLPNIANAQANERIPRPGGTTRGGHVSEQQQWLPAISPTAGPNSSRVSSLDGHSAASSAPLPRLPNSYLRSLLIHSGAVDPAIPTNGGLRGRIGPGTTPSQSLSQAPTVQQHQAPRLHRASRSDGSSHEFPQGGSPFATPEYWSEFRVNRVERRRQARQRARIDSRAMPTIASSNDFNSDYEALWTYVRETDYDHSPGHESESSEDMLLEHGLSQSAIARLPRRERTKGAASLGIKIAQLESISTDDLAEHERSCPICYNDYGVEGPEGTNEAPLRLKKCKHVFGDHCIKKWLGQKDCCPYCRETVSEAQVWSPGTDSGGRRPEPSRTVRPAPPSTSRDIATERQIRAQFQQAHATIVERQATQERALRAQQDRNTLNQLSVANGSHQSGDVPTFGGYRNMMLLLDRQGDGVQQNDNQQYGARRECRRRTPSPHPEDNQRRTRQRRNDQNLPSVNAPTNSTDGVQVATSGNNRPAVQNSLPLPHGFNLSQPFGTYALDQAMRAPSQPLAARFGSAQLAPSQISLPFGPPPPVTSQGQATGRPGFPYPSMEESIMPQWTPGSDFGATLQPFPDNSSIPSMRHHLANPSPFGGQIMNPQSFPTFSSSHNDTGVNGQGTSSGSSMAHNDEGAPLQQGHQYLGSTSSSNRGRFW